MRLLTLAVCAMGFAACAARTPARPDAPGESHPPAIELFNAATRHCQGLRSVTTAMRLSGRTGDERLSGTLITGLEAPASVRFEAVAPFGRPVFILAGTDGRATLLLPRDDMVLRDTPVPDVLQRLTGLRLTAEDLRMLLTGCLAQSAAPEDPRRYNDEWSSVALGDGRVAYLRTVTGRPRVVAADDGEWHVDYSQFQNDWARRVRIRSAGGDVDMTAVLDDLEVNTSIDPRAWQVEVPSGAKPITLEHLRSVVPLREPQS